MRAVEFIKEVEVVDEMALPADWDPTMLGHDKTFKSRLQYVRQRAARLGSGSSRIAVIIPDNGRDTVLKVAKNKKGMAQNEAEVEILKDGYLGRLDIVIPLVDYDKENPLPTWLQTEKANKVDNRKLRQLLHCDKTNWGLSYFVDAVRVKAGQPKRYSDSLQSIKESLLKAGQSEEDLEIFMGYADEVAELIDSSSLLPDDLNNPSNWGEYKGRPVIIDLGFTEAVMPLYYGS